MRSFARVLVCFVVVALVTPVVSAGVVLATSIFLALPATIPEPRPGLDSRISRVFDVDGNEIAVFREFETSIPVAPADIPQVLKDAVIASEDRNFYSHSGIDLEATGRALLADVRSGEVVQGGSTITQQYVRNAFEEVGTEVTVSRKIREAILASQLERQISKAEILFRYLSTIYLGEGAYGVGAASETYFRKPVSELTLSEAALVAGVIPAPSRYSPRVDPAIAEQRRLLALDAMLDEAMITPEEHAAAVAEPVWLMVNGEPPGPATRVWPPVQQQSVHPWFTDYVRRWLFANLPGCNPQSCDLLFRGGLRIETTIDPRAQAAALEEVARQLEGNEPDLEMAIVAVEPPTGFVRALVGGRDYNLSQVNTALGAAGGGTDRQPGSAFKPFVLAAAFDAGVPPTATYSGGTHVTETHTFGNYGGATFGTMTLRSATHASVNTVYTRLIADVGVEQAMAMADRLGADMPPYDPAVYGLAVALGAVEASPLEMASAYGVFANGGRRATPTPVLRVFDAQGELLIDNSEAQEQAVQVIGPEVADNVTDVLRGVLTEGTARGKGIGRPAAGKTGTTDDNSNAWFIGYTPTLSTAVWMGYRQEANRPLRGINGVSNVTGGSLPASSWQRVMERALEGVPATDFHEPAPIRDEADRVRLEQRGGFDLGPRRFPSGPPGGGPYEQSIDPPTAAAPPTTTTTTTLATTTTTTGPGDDDEPPPFTIFPGPDPPDD